MRDDALVAPASRAGGLQIAVLGALTVTLDGRRIVVSPPKLCVVLVVLALSTGEPVLHDRFATALWGEDPPKDVRRTLQLYITRLRKLLKDGLIQTVPGGYLLAANPNLVDVVRFERLLDTARRADDEDEERAMLDEALSIWRGEPFYGMQSAWLENRVSPRLSTRRLAALERRIELDLAARRTAGLITEIEELTDSFPLREQYWAYLMTALTYSGRRAEALATFQRLYRLLAEELGIEPSQIVRDLHRQILKGDLALSSQPADYQVAVRV